MFSELEPYTHYEFSGVRWLGDVPAHWTIRRLKTYVENVVDQTEEYEEGEICLALEDVESWTGRYEEAGSYAGLDSQAKRFRVGDVLFCKLRPYLAKVARPNRAGICVSEFLVLRPSSSEVTSHYLEQLLRSRPVVDAIDASTFGAKMPRAEWQFIGGMDQPVPPLEEQAAIVCYLDHVDQHVRRYLDGKEKLISLLKEQRQAAIHRAVTRGLDANTRLKPSGIEWLGTIPAHWQMRRLQSAVDMKVSNVDKDVKEDEIPIRLCNYVDVYKNDRIIENVPFMRATATADEIDRFRIESGDVLITKDSEAWDDIGVPAIVEYSAEDVVCGYHLALLRPSKTLLSGAYLFRALQCPAIACQFHMAANGVTRYGLSHHAIKSAFFPVPPLSEQVAIVEYLDKATADIDAAIDRAHREIELMREYRERLIADVVTGRLDVREAAGQLPEPGEKADVR